MIFTDYAKLAAAQEFYQSRGFQIVDAPWWSTEEVQKLTYRGKPEYQLSTTGKFLNGSGEQGLLYMATKGLLPAGRYQTTTPCFRYESQDSTHRKCFLKTELMDTKSVNDETLQIVIGAAMTFFGLYLPGDIKLVQTHDPISEISYDLEFDGIEVGSYGIRRIGQFEWVYGTGVAEPRLTSVIKKFEIAEKNR